MQLKSLTKSTDALDLKDEKIKRLLNKLHNYIWHLLSSFYLNYVTLKGVNLKIKNYHS